MADGKELCTLILLIISPGIIFIEGLVSLIKLVYKRHLHTGITPTTATYSGFYIAIHRTIHQCFNQEVGSGTALCIVSILHQGPDDFGASIVICQEDVTVIRSQRIITFRNHFLGIFISIGIFILAYPCFGIQIDTCQEKPSRYTIHTTILIPLRFFQQGCQFFRFGNHIVVDFLAGLLMGNRTYIHRFINERTRTVQVANHAVAISTDEACFSTVIRHFSLQSIVYATVFQFPFRAFAQELITVVNGHIQTII